MFPIVAIDWVLFSVTKFLFGYTTIAGIRIVNSNRRDPDGFIKICDMAIGLIGSVDPYRLDLVRSQVRYIVAGDLVTLGVYKRYNRACEVDLGNLPISDDENYTVVMLATCLVHEAVHGKLDSHCIPYAGKLKLRAELLCNKQSNAFLRKLPGEWEQLASPEDAKGYTEEFSIFHEKRLNKVKLVLGRILRK